jgi:hypothetical protein
VIALDLGPFGRKGLPLPPNDKGGGPLAGFKEGMAFKSVRPFRVLFPLFPPSRFSDSFVRKTSFSASKTPLLRPSR